MRRRFGKGGCGRCLYAGLTSNGPRSFRKVCQSTAPVAASSPYTQLFSVAAIRVLPMTSGCPYTEPLTAVEKIWPNDPPLTAAG